MSAADWHKCGRPIDVASGNAYLREVVRFYDVADPVCKQVHRCLCGQCRWSLRIARECRACRATAVPNPDDTKNLARLHPRWGGLYREDSPEYLPPTPSDRR